ncbi:MAG: hypothetical protein QXT79_08175 [Thermofilaceae archaeon]
MLILAGYVEEFMLLDQPLITLVEQIVNEPPEDAHGETYEGDSVNIPGGSGSGIGDWGRFSSLRIRSHRAAIKL